MLLNTLQYTGKPPKTKNFLAKIDNNVEIEKSSALGRASDKSSLPF